MANSRELLALGEAYTEADRRVSQAAKARRDAFHLLRCAETADEGARPRFEHEWARFKAEEHRDGMPSHGAIMGLAQASRALVEAAEALKRSQAAVDKAKAVERAAERAAADAWCAYEKACGGNQ